MSALVLVLGQDMRFAVAQAGSDPKCAAPMGFADIVEKVKPGGSGQHQR